MMWVTDLVSDQRAAAAAQVWVLKMGADEDSEGMGSLCIFS